MSYEYKFIFDNHLDANTFFDSISSSDLIVKTEPNRLYLKSRLAQIEGGWFYDAFLTKSNIEPIIFFTTNTRKVLLDISLLFSNNLINYIYKIEDLEFSDLVSLSQIFS